MIDAAATALLQWGRVLVNAEGGTHGTSDAGTRKLQWGRVLVNAEGRAVLPGQHSRLPLQWGRVLVNAEGEPFDHRISCFDGGFNGAASW